MAFSKEPVRYSFNNHRHCVFKVDDFVFYCKFSKDRFQKFTKAFPKFALSHPEYSECVGDSINIEAMNYINTCKSKIFLIFAYSEDEIYILNPLRVFKFCEANNLYRKQLVFNKYINRSKKDKQKEQTVSIPFHPDFFRDFKTIVKNLGGIN